MPTTAPLASNWCSTQHPLASPSGEGEGDGEGEGEGEGDGDGEHMQAGAYEVYLSLPKSDGGQKGSVEPPSHILRSDQCSSSSHLSERHGLQPDSCK